MTLPYERTRAVNEMANAVLRLAPYLHNRRDRPKVMVPTDLLRDLVARLRHYPTQYDMKRTAELAPELWGDA